MVSAPNEYRWQELKIDLEHNFHATVTEEMRDSFLRHTGGFNPLHMDASYAAKSEFTDRYVCGFYTSSLYSTLVGVYLPEKFCLLHELDISFQNLIFIDDMLTISSQVSYVNDAYKQAEVRAKIVNANREKTSKVNIKVGLFSGEIE